jgi:hypothetical protein
MKRIITPALIVLSFVALLCLSSTLRAGHGDGTSFILSARTQSQEDDNARKTSPKRCSNRTLRGDYGYTASGFTTAASPVPAPLQGAFASSGLATFDGQGGFKLTATSSFNGVIQGPVTVHGTYSVSDDCTYTSQADNGATFRSVIVDDAKF